MTVVSPEEAARLRRRQAASAPGVGMSERVMERFAEATPDVLAGRAMLFTFFQELAEPVKKLMVTAWRARGKLAADLQAYAVLIVATMCSMPGRMTKVINNPRLRGAIAEEEDPMALAAVVCGTSGAVTIGAFGAIVGACVGGGSGLIVGAVPAIFTFGLSLPIGAAFGGMCGMFAGAAAGAGAGAAAGATSGMTAAYFRDEISFVALHVASRIYDAYDLVVVRPVDAVRRTGRRVREGVHSTTDFTRQKAAAVGSAVANATSDPGVRVTAASAAVGAATLGTAGAAGGALAGGATGLIIGIVPAVFTFGLSIPIGALVGSGTGMCVGGAAGVSVGFCGGGALGATGYACREAPSTARKFARGFMRGATSAFYGTVQAADPAMAGAPPGAAPLGAATPE